MKIKNTLNGHSFSSIELRSIDATDNGDEVDHVDMVLSMEVGGDTFGQFKDDGILLRVEIKNSRENDNPLINKLVISMRPEEAYGLYKAIGFYLDEYNSIIPVNQKDA